MDICFDSQEPGMCANSTTSYLKDLKVQLQENLQHVSKFLGITRDRMVKQYNKNLKVHKYQVNDEVWLHKRTFKPGENVKLAPRKTGPWTVIATYPNGVNYRIQDNLRNKR